MAIPERNPVGYPFSGIVAQCGDDYVLAHVSQESLNIVARGDFIIRPGLEYLGKPQYAIVPGLLALDYGEVLSGEEAWEFLIHRSNLHPRADVIGYRNDGVDEMIVVKWLDVAQPVWILAYDDEQATVPIARVRAYIGPDTTGIDENILTYLPHYTRVEEWQADQHE